MQYSCARPVKVYLSLQIPRRRALSSACAKWLRQAPLDTACDPPCEMTKLKGMRCKVANIYEANQHSKQMRCGGTIPRVNGHHGCISPSIVAVQNLQL